MSIYMAYKHIAPDFSFTEKILLFMKIYLLN